MAHQFYFSKLWNEQAILLLLPLLSQSSLLQISNSRSLKMANRNLVSAIITSFLLGGSLPPKTTLTVAPVRRGGAADPSLNPPLLQQKNRRALAVAVADFAMAAAAHQQPQGMAFCMQCEVLGGRFSPNLRIAEDLGVASESPAGQVRAGAPLGP